MVPNTSVFTGLRDKIDQAVAKHQRGQHSVEQNSLNAFIDQISGQLGGGASSGINLVVGARLRAFARDAVARRI